MADLDSDAAKWGGAPHGSPGGTVSYAFATADAFSAFNAFDAALVEAPLQALVLRALDAWSDVADIRFVPAPEGEIADIEFGWSDLDGPGGTLAETASQRLAGTQLRAAVRMDAAESWSADVALDPTESTLENFYAVVAHELGHVIGLAHDPSPGALMHAFALDVVDITLAEAKRAAAIYGPATHVAGPEDDVLAGDARANLLRPGAGDDLVAGLGGADTILGGAGDDLLRGGARGDELQGQGGADRLSGAGGRDALFGGAGADRLSGGDDKDVMTGGAGADLFALEIQRHGRRDLVEDFGNGRDRILVRSGAAGFDELELRAHGGDALVIDGAAKLLLAGVSPDELHPRDFLF